MSLSARQDLNLVCLPISPSPQWTLLPSLDQSFPLDLVALRVSTAEHLGIRFDFSPGSQVQGRSERTLPEFLDSFASPQMELHVEAHQLGNDRIPRGNRQPLLLAMPSMVGETSFFLANGLPAVMIDLITFDEIVIKQLWLQTTIEARSNMLSGLKVLDQAQVSLSDRVSVLEHILTGSLLCLHHALDERLHVLGVLLHFAP